MVQIRYFSEKNQNIKRFKSRLKDFFNLKEKSLFATHDPAGIKLCLRLRLKFNDLNELKFLNNFKDALGPICDCDSKTEKRDHFFLRCPFLCNK